MAGITAAVNAFSVVGLADVVFRLGVDTAGLYSRYRNASKDIASLVDGASKDIASLVDEIQGFIELLAQIRVYLDAYHQSPYVQEDGETIPPQLAKTLTGCEKELRDLQQLANKNKHESHDGLAVQIMKSWRWALQNEHVAKYCKRIRHYNTRLQTILDLIGRRSEIVLRRELKLTRTDIDTAGLVVHQTLSGMEDRLNSKQEKNNKLILNQSDLISQIVKQSEDRILKQSQDHYLELLEQIPHLTLEQTEDDDFIFQGDNLGAIVLPLLLVKSDLYKAVQTLQKEGILKVSHSEAQCILQHFDNLVAKAHEAAAQDLNATPWNSRTKAIPRSSDMKAKKGPSRKGQEHIPPGKRLCAFDRMGRIEHISKVCIDAGVLLLETGSSKTFVKCDQNSAALQVFRLSFYPRPGISSVNISMLMTNEFGRSVELQIPRLIQTYNTIPWKSDTVSRILDDDVIGLENIFKTGNGSPNDVLENGLSLPMIAAPLQNTAFYEFLVREGANTSIFTPWSGSGKCISVLELIWPIIRRKPRLGTPSTAKAVIDNALHLSSLAIKHGCDPNMLSTGFQDNVIHSFIRYYEITRGNAETVEKDLPRSYNSVQLSINEFREIFSSMVGMGCELEGRDVYDNTALTLACSYVRPNTISALINIGADVHATINNGSGVLHYLLVANEHRQEYDDSLYRGLVILLANKCDPNHLNKFGVSPSDVACRNPGRHNSWVRAVRQAGYELLLLETSVLKCGHEEEISVVVSAEFEVPNNESRLPVSNMTLDEWSKKRRERR